MLDLLSLAEIISDEEKAIKFIESKCTKKIACKFCHSKQYYFMKSKNRMRCKSCKKDFRPFADSGFSTVKMSYSRWLGLIMLFELYVSARTASKKIGLSYKTTLNAFEIIRIMILEELARTDKQLKGEIEADESYFGGKRKGNRGRGAKNKTIVFGILERRGKVHVEIVKNVKAETLLGGTIKKVRRGSIVYTDKWKGYDSLVFHGYRHLSVDHRKKFASDQVYINGIEGFWSFAKLHLAKYRGINSEKFLLYIKELEWRYNNRESDLFDLLVRYMLGAEFT